MDQDGVADRVERVFPLLPDRGDLLKQANILQCHPEQVGHIYEVGEFAGSKPSTLRSADCDHSQRPVFPGECKCHERFQPCFVQSFLRGGIPFILRFQKVAFLLQYSVRPGFLDGNFGILRKKPRLITDRSASYELGVLALSFLQANHSMRSV